MLAVWEWKHLQLLKAVTLVVLVGCSTSSSEPTTRPAATKAVSVKPNALPKRITARVSAVDGRTSDQIAQAACAGATGWRCAISKKETFASGSVGVPPASWSVPHWYVDGLNQSTCASDSNTCTSATCSSAGVGPCLTLGQIGSRFGTWSPTLQQPTIITLVSSTPATDLYRFNPIFIGTGNLTVQGTFSQSVAVTLGTVTAPNYATGTLGKITASGQSGTYWSSACGGTCIGKYVKDSTANAYFYIRADLGTATASIDQPIVPLSFGTYATIANGDALSVGSWSTFYADTFPYIGEGNGGVTVQQCTVNTDSFVTYPRLSTFVEDTFPHAVESDISGLAPFFYGCYIDAYYNNGSFFTSVISGDSGAVSNFSGCQFDGDSIVGLRFHEDPASGPMLMDRVYLGQSTPDTDVTPAIYQVGVSQYGTERIWGPTTFDTSGGSTLSIRSAVGSFAGIVLLTGGLTADGASTAFPWLAGSHAYGAAVSITPSNIDSNNSLRNPVTGSGFFVDPG